MVCYSLCLPMMCKPIRILGSHGRRMVVVGSGTPLLNWIEVGHKDDDAVLYKRVQESYGMFVRIGPEVLLTIDGNQTSLGTHVSPLVL